MRRDGLRAAKAGAGRILAGSIFAVFLVWLGCAAFAAGPEPYAPLTRPLVVEQVSGEPIYYTLGNPGVPNHDNEGNISNAGFIVTASGVVVFDALGTPSLGWNLLQHFSGDGAFGIQDSEPVSGTKNFPGAATPAKSSRQWFAALWFERPAFGPGGSAE